MSDVSILSSVSIIIGIAAALTIFFRAIRQPSIIAYLVAGVLVGPLFFGIIGIGSESGKFLEIFASMGVALLLFIVGLSLDFRVLKEFGKVSTFAGIGKGFITAILGFIIALWLGFEYTPALYLAAALAFSSTVVVVKILSDKKEIDSLHGKIALGILIVEDFIAALVLMIVPLLESHDSSLIFLGIFKIIILIGTIFFVSYLFMNKLMHYLARHQETLFLFGISWALVLAAIFNYFGLSLEIGALIAGMSLASSKYTLELGGKIKPLRDFFVVLLFVFFGSRLVGPIEWVTVKEAIIFSVVILIGKPIVTMSFVRLFGYKKRTVFLTGTAFGQISEFSLIIILIGFNLGHLTQEFMNLAILISLITITLSSYSIYYSRTIFGKISHLLDILEKGKVKKDEKINDEKYDLILFGYHRTGYNILKMLKKKKMKFLVVDINPRVILTLEEEGIKCVFGDASSRDLINELPIEKAKMVISTVSEEEANLNIRDKIKSAKSKTIFLATAEPRNALDLYEEGVDYVIIPHHLGGRFVADMIDSFGTDREKYKFAGKEHYKDLIKGKKHSKFL